MWITRNHSQRAVTIQRLETIEQLTGDFQVWFHPETHEHEFLDLLRRSYSQRPWSDPRDGEVRCARRSRGRGGLSLPERQATDRTFLKTFIGSDRADDTGNSAMRFNEIKLTGFSRFVCGERPRDTRWIAREI